MACRVLARYDGRQREAGRSYRRVPVFVESYYSAQKVVECLLGHAEITKVELRVAKAHFLH